MAAKTAQKTERLKPRSARKRAGSFLRWLKVAVACLLLLALGAGAWYLKDRFSAAEDAASDFLRALLGVTTYDSLTGHVEELAARGLVTYDEQMADAAARLAVDCAMDAFGRQRFYESYTADTVLDELRAQEDGEAAYSVRFDFERAAKELTALWLARFRARYENEIYSGKQTMQQRWNEEPEDELKMFLFAAESYLLGSPDIAGSGYESAYPQLGLYDAGGARLIQKTDFCFSYRASDAHLYLIANDETAFATLGGYLTVDITAAPTGGFLVDEQGGSLLTEEQEALVPAYYAELTADFVEAAAPRASFVRCAPDYSTYSLAAMLACGGEGEPQGGFVWPTAQPAHIALPYGGYTDAGGDAFRDGAVIEGAQLLGSGVLAAADGMVAMTGYERGGRGDFVAVAHGGGVFTVYTGLSGTAVLPGDEVKAGALLGFVGAGGADGGVALGFELWRGGESADPEPYIGEAGG